jgi:hypothetical protein
MLRSFVGALFWVARHREKRALRAVYPVMIAHGGLAALQSRSG